MIAYQNPFLIPVDVRLAGVICEDGIELLGLVSRRTHETHPPVTLLHFSGQFRNAYQERTPHALLLAADRAGLGCVLANNRGQDATSFQRRYPSRAGGEAYTWSDGGSTYEMVTDGAKDVRAWVELAVTLSDGAPVVLIGHSHGAVKVASFMCEEEVLTRHVAGVVLLSPPDDVGTHRHRLGDRYEEAFAVAARMVEDSEGFELMPKWCFPGPISAATYLEAFPPQGSPLEIFSYEDPGSSPLATRGSWSRPTQVIFGEADTATGNLASPEAAEALAGLLADTDSCDIVIQAGRDHHYTGGERDVAAAVVDWCAGLTGGVAAASLGGAACRR